jgi:hypothetical protein
MEPTQGQGLLNGMQPPGAAPVAPPAAPDAGVPPQAAPVGKQPVQSSLDTRDYEQDPPNEKDQESVDRVNLNAIRLIHDPQATQSILASVKQADHPIQGVTNASIEILRRLEKEEADKGQQMNDFIRLAGGLTITSEIANLAKEAGVIKEFTEEENKILLAQTVQDYTNGEIESGRRTSADVSMQARQGGERYAELNPDTPAGEKINAVEEKQDPFNPTETMSQKLERGI